MKPEFLFHSIYAQNQPKGNLTKLHWIRWVINVHNFLFLPEVRGLLRMTEQNSIQPNTTQEGKPKQAK